jgi:hypothetical protein
LANHAVWVRREEKLRDASRGSVPTADSISANRMMSSGDAFFPICVVNNLDAFNLEAGKAPKQRHDR